MGGGGVEGGEVREAVKQVFWVKGKEMGSIMQCGCNLGPVIVVGKRMSLSILYIFTIFSQKSASIR